MINGLFNRIMCPIGPCIRDLYTKIRSHINSEIFVLSTTCIYPRSSTTNQIIQSFQSRILFPPQNSQYRYVYSTHSWWNCYHDPKFFKNRNSPFLKILNARFYYIHSRQFQTLNVNLVSKYIYIPSTPLKIQSQQLQTSKHRTSSPSKLIASQTSPKWQNPILHIFFPKILL